MKLNIKSWKIITYTAKSRSWLLMILYSELRIAVADCVTFEAVSAICITYFKYYGRAANAIRIFESKKFMSSASAICFSKLELISRRGINSEPGIIKNHKFLESAKITKNDFSTILNCWTLFFLSIISHTTTSFEWIKSRHRFSTSSLLIFW